MKPLYPLLINEGICTLIELDINKILIDNHLPLDPVTDDKGKKYYSDMLFKISVILENIYSIKGLPLSAYTLIAQFACNIHYHSSDINSLTFQKHFETYSKRLIKALKNNDMQLNTHILHQCLMIAYQIKCAHFGDYHAKIKSFDYIYDKDQHKKAQLSVECV